MWFSYRGYMQRTVIEAGQKRKTNFFKSYYYIFKNMFGSRELIGQLFKRDFIAVYKKSFIGVGWVLIAPLIGIISWVIMNATNILKPGNVGIPYPAFVLLSTSIWGLFMGFYTAGADTLKAGEGFIMQVKFPHEALLIKQTAQHLANFILAFILNIIVLIYFGVTPSWKIVFFPLMVIPLFMFASSIGLMISLISAISLDVRKWMDYIVGLLMFVTPVIYSSHAKHPTLKTILKWNPLTYLVGGIRDVIIYGKLESVQGYIFSVILAFVLFMLSLRLFYVSEDVVIEKMI